MEIWKECASFTSLKSSFFVRVETLLENMVKCNAFSICALSIGRYQSHLCDGSAH